MYCPHCETPLAKAEIAMDNTYKDVTEEAVTIKFKVIGEEDLFLLAWTTTPWTLPGNVALAVGPDIDYVIIKKDDARYIVARERVNSVFGEEGYEILEEKKGIALFGLEYEPLYVIEKVAKHEGRKWVVLPAEFVTTGEGTGIVHTAVIYGEDDYALGLSEGLPMVPLLNANATYNTDAPEFLQGKYIKKAEADIKADLETRGLLFAKALNTHSYPHCYRCGTALIYNAVSSWFINIQAIKQRLLEENQNVTWTPEHLKHGRFTHIVETAPDWTISRNRFWASPLPIWKDTDGNVTVVGSLAELKALTRKSGNQYLAMRHGEAESTLKEIISCARDENPLTEAGREQVRQNAASLRGVENIRIFASPVLRALQSAQVLAEELGIPESDIIIDERLCEFKLGSFEGKKLSEFLEWRTAHAYDEKVEGGESHADARRRFGEFLYEVENTYRRETIVMVTHGIGLESLSVVAEGLAAEKAKTYVEGMSHQPGALIEIDFTPLPHTREYELDFHLPYIDQIQLETPDGRPLTRIPEVVDCWVESGSMPFAEYHYPMENKELFDSRSPGDFVSEYIGQTRAWFYYMHAISVSLFDRAPFKNVVTTGTILAANGEKLSKSKKNFTDPYLLFDQYSADAFRYYLMSSVVMQAEDLTFRDEDVKEAQNRVVNMIRNIHAFYALYKDDLNEHEKRVSTHVLDRWILVRLNEVIENATDAFDRYDIPRAVRPLRDFIEDFSTWYVRRSRDRIKSADEADKQAALRTMRHVLTEFSKVIAPVMPFVADEVYRAVRKDSDPESVHLAEWPHTKRSLLSGLFGPKDTGLREGMKKVRAISSTALMERQKANIKVRQPLAALYIRESGLSSELLALVQEELNVKKILVDATLPEGEVRLDTELTPELVREGDVREFVRAVQEARKSLDLSPRDTVTLTIEKSAEAVLKDAVIPNTAQVEFSDGEHPYRAELSGASVAFSVARSNNAS